MTLSEILQDVHATQEDLLMYERKYNILTETFYESFMQGDEPPDDSWVLDWNMWAGSYEVWLDRKQRYQHAVAELRRETPLVNVIAKAVRREPLSIPA
ncbi:MAG: hypothetical protein K0U66_04040 [Gammaproteobacteria bacterium]|nr:hypothetical protein [Gammaproteobacteria bacterium]